MNRGSSVGLHDRCPIPGRG